MKRLFQLVLLFIATVVLSSCTPVTDSSSSDEWRCGSYNGNTLYTGPKGGCYYYNSNGNKTYVDRSNCDC